MALAALPASQKPRGKRAADGKLKVPQKQGAHQIFSSAEATRMLCNELFDMMKEEKEERREQKGNLQRHTGRWGINKPPKIAKTIQLK